MNKILMVDQEVKTIQKVQERLSYAGFEIFSAFDGRHGFQIAKEKIPNLIITDASVPVMSGYELCKAIKTDQDTKSIPIIVMTEKHLLEESFMTLGINDFLNKPLIMDELENLVTHKLKFSQITQQQKSKILINGRPEILSCCQQLLKSDPHWIGYCSYNSEFLLRDAVGYVPDVILLDLLMTDVPADEMIIKLKSIPELKNTVILTYHATSSLTNEFYAIQAEMIEVQYMKITTQAVGAREYLGVFNPVTFLNLINIYRKDFEV